MEENKNIKLCDIVGNFGKYQFAVMAINFAASMVCGYSMVFIELLAPSVNVYWNWEASNPNKTIFKQMECKMADILEHNRTSNLSNSLSKLIYESKYSRRTLTEEMNMICERSWFLSFSFTMVLVGIFIGVLLFTRASEIYGRTRCTVYMAIVNVISNLLILFSQGYVMFILTVTLHGATSANMSTLIFFQVIEMAPTAWSEYAGVFSKTGFLFGQTLLVGVAWILQDWFYTQLFQTLFAGAFFLSLMFILESPVWFAVRGKYDQAEKTINRIVVRNGLDPEAAKPNIVLYLDQMKRRCENTAEKGKFLDLFKNRVIALYTLASSFARGLVFFMYMSLIMNAESFGSGMYVDLTISNLLALACFLVSMALLMKFSLRSQMIFLCLCGGTSCIFYTFLNGIPVARSALIILGRCFMSPVTNMLFVYAAQISPTSVRGVTAGFGFAVAGILSSFAPFTKELGEKTAPYVPFILFTFCGFVTAGLLKMLPETRGKELVHTVDELVKKKNEVPNAVGMYRSKQTE